MSGFTIFFGIKTIQSIRNYKIFHENEQIREETKQLQNEYIIMKSNILKIQGNSDEILKGNALSGKDRVYLPKKVKLKIQKDTQ
jgi:hypothetical protein